MARADHADRQVQTQNLVNFFGDEFAERSENIGIIFQSLGKQLRLIHHVVIQRLGCVVLPKGVVAEKNVFSRHIGEHGVGPVKHLRFHKNQLAVSDLERVAGFHGHKVPVLMVVAFQNLCAVGRAVNRRIRNFTHQLRQSAAVVDLVVVHHNVIYAVQVNLLLQAGDELLVKGLPHRIHQHGFLVAYQIRIVGRPSVCRIFIPVKSGKLPVHLADPADFIC